MADDKELMSRVEEIQTLAQTNEDMMKQIDNMGSRVVNLTTYVIRCNYGIFTVKEVQEAQNANQIVNNWRENIQLTEIEDIFNDKISYTCSSYGQLKTVNSAMARVVKKYKLFGSSRTALGEIYKFAKNFRVIKAVLERIIALLNNGGGGRMDKIRERLDNLNNEMKALRTTYTNIQFS
ncbi:unnamed protein product [Adineta ricciae]|uniref:Uncharacterized protein n=1 Tax=Adineta ricciae TaxID=249248 RepID=A0A814UEP9_ADIRI|nr:unnamed protein product [Adineta ricciae]